MDDGVLLRFRSGFRQDGKTFENRGDNALLFNVNPKKEQELRERMARCGIQESDLEERFIRAGGPGGQNVNRSATCVYLRHIPTGFEVKMQKARSQALNRFFARRRLCELVEQEALGRESPLARKQEKIRKQKARRHGRALHKNLLPNSESAS